MHVVLTSRFSMWMAWGPELTFFCNDKYRRDTLGTKYPWALGRPAADVWAEIWSDIGPRIETVLETGVASWDESLLLILERDGYPEETYHTFSYSPLSDESGAVSGLLCVVSEDTERVVGDRRMNVLRCLGAASDECADRGGGLRRRLRGARVRPDGAAVRAALRVRRARAPISRAVLERLPATRSPRPHVPTDRCRGRSQGSLAAPQLVVDDLVERFADVPRGVGTSRRRSRCSSVWTEHPARRPTASWSPASTGFGSSTRTTADS